MGRPVSNAKCSFSPQATQANGVSRPPPAYLAWVTWPWAGRCTSSLPQINTYHSSLGLVVLFFFNRGGNPFATVRLRPTVTNDRSAPIIWPVHISTHTQIPSQPSCVIGSRMSSAACWGLNWTRPNEASAEKKTPFERGIPLLLQAVIFKYFGSVLFYRTDAHIFMIDLYIYMYFFHVCFCPPDCGGDTEITTFLPALD